MTHAVVTSSGEYICASESGFVIYWNVPKEEVYKLNQKTINTKSVKRTFVASGDIQRGAEECSASDALRGRV